VEQLPRKAALQMVSGVSCFGTPGKIRNPAPPRSAFSKELTKVRPQSASRESEVVGKNGFD
jgi:hypothetical protein